MTDEDPTLRKFKAFVQASAELDALFQPLFRQRMSEEIYSMKYGPEAARRRTIEEIPTHPELLAAFDEYKARYDALIDEGEEKGFLEHGPDGDVYPHIERVSRRTTWEEPWEDYQKRIEAMEPLFGQREVGGGEEA
jgi:hypothetical protein